MTDPDGAASFTRWASERQQALLRTAVLLCGDHHRAEDLVQDALTKVAVRWSRLRDQHPDAYARQVMVRANISWWRKHRREVLTAYDVEQVSAAPEPERRILLLAALATLTPRQRAVIVLRYFEDLTERQVAEMLGVSVGTVKSQTHVSLRRLRDAAPGLAEFLHEES